MTDQTEAISRLRRACSLADAQSSRGNQTQFTQDIRALLDRLDSAEREATAPVPELSEADRKDAERYRWLREEHMRFDPLCHLSWKKNSDRNTSDWVNTSDLDNSIDAAIAAKKEGV